MHKRRRRDTSFRSRTRRRSANVATGNYGLIFIWKKRSSGPTPLRQIRAHNREYKQPKNRQGQNHHHHGATLQTPVYSATRWPITPASFSTTYPVVSPNSVASGLHYCHPTPTLCTPVLAPLSHYSRSVSCSSQLPLPALSETAGCASLAPPAFSPLRKTKAAQPSRAAHRFLLI
jgi:hypothetical protein